MTLENESRFGIIDNVLYYRCTACQKEMAASQVDDPQLEPAASTKITKIAENQMYIERFYFTGQLKFTGIYNYMIPELEQEPLGTFIEPDTIETIDNTREGMAHWWYQNGTVMKKGYYYKGKPAGLWEFYWRNEHIRERGEYFNGDRQGVWEWYHENGEKEKTIDYGDNGRPARMAYTFEGQQIRVYDTPN